MRSDIHRGQRTLSLLLVAYAATSLLHFAHNAIHLHEYPNLPRWLTATDVCLAWCGITSIGAAGYWLYHHGSRRAGLLTMMVYALLGFAGLDHYAVAPIAAHSIAMNATVAAEVTAAAALLKTTVRNLQDARGSE